jgi:hypothetical protein
MANLTIPGDVDRDMVVGLRDVIISLQIQTGQYDGQVRLTADVNSDGQIGMEETIFALQKSSEL